MRIKLYFNTVYCAVLFPHTAVVSISVEVLGFIVFIEFTQFEISAENLNSC